MPLFCVVRSWADLVRNLSRDADLAPRNLPDGRAGAGAADEGSGEQRLRHLQRGQLLGRPVLAACQRTSPFALQTRFMVDRRQNLTRAKGWAGAGRATCGTERCDEAAQAANRGWQLPKIRGKNLRELAPKLLRTSLGVQCWNYIWALPEPNLCRGYSGHPMGFTGSVRSCVAEVGPPARSEHHAPGASVHPKLRLPRPQSRWRRRGLRARRPRAVQGPTWASVRARRIAESAATTPTPPVPQHLSPNRRRPPPPIPSPSLPHTVSRALTSARAFHESARVPMGAPAAATDHLGLQACGPPACKRLLQTAPASGDCERRLQAAFANAPRAAALASARRTAHDRHTHCCVRATDKVEFKELCQSSASR